MLLASVDKAMAARLMGFDIVDLSKGALRAAAARGSSQGDVNMAAWDAQRNEDIAVRVGTTTLYGKLPTAVPLFRFSPRGARAVEVWPSLSYEMIGLQFNPQRFIMRHDSFRSATRDSLVQVETRDGSTHVGPSLRDVRPHPEPYDVMFEVRVWSRNEGEALRMLDVLLRLLPARGALKGVLGDGSVVLWNMLQQSINNVDAEEPAAADRRQREYSWVLTYVVEAHIDNTDDKRKVPTVLATDVELVPH